MSNGIKAALLTFLFITGFIGFVFILKIFPILLIAVAIILSVIVTFMIVMAIFLEIKEHLDIKEIDKFR